MPGNEIWGPITGPSGSQAAVARSLARCSFDFTLLKPGLLQGNEWSGPGKTQIPVNVRSLANFAQEATERGVKEGIDYHAILVNSHTGELLDHEHAVHEGVIAADDHAPAVLGLFWFHGLVEVEEALLGNPALFDEVFHSEGAHATDFFHMLPTGKREAAHALLCGHSPRDAWFQPSPYFQQVGEGFMGIFVKAFTDLPVTLWGFSHHAIEPTVGLIKNLLMPVAEPPAPPPDPPSPPSEPDPLAPDIWDARSFVTKPEGRGEPMGPLAGWATHHTVTVLRAMIERGLADTLAEAVLAGEAASIALAHAETLSADSTIVQELEHIKVIDAAHRTSFGLYAYHLTAFPSGRVYLTGSLDGQRAHVANRNHELLGVAFVGDFSNALPSEVQLQAGAKALKYAGAGLADAQQWRIQGHQLWGTQTICAGRLNGFDWTSYFQDASPPPPQGVRVADVSETPTHFEITFAGSGVVTIQDGDVWPLEKAGATGRMTHVIKAP